MTVCCPPYTLLSGCVLGDQGFPQAHNYPTQEVTAPLGGYPVEGAETGVSAGEQGGGV